MNFNEKQTKKKNCFPHGSRIMDLDVFRSSLKCCQHCKAGEKKQYFLPKEKPKSTRIKLNSQFYGKYMYTQFWGYNGSTCAVWPNLNGIYPRCGSKTSADIYWAKLITSSAEGSAPSSTEMKIRPVDFF